MLTRNCRFQSAGVKTCNVTLVVVLVLAPSGRPGFLADMHETPESGPLLCQHSGPIGMNEGTQRVLNFNFNEDNLFETRAQLIDRL